LKEARNRFDEETVTGDANGCDGRGCWNRDEAIAIEMSESSIGQSEDGAVDGSQRQDVGRRESFCGPVMLECPAAVAHDAIGGPDPYRAVFDSLGEAADVIAGDGRGIVMLEHPELYCIRSGYTAFGSDPEIAVP
jgi:hypothetical protein